MSTIARIENLLTDTKVLLARYEQKLQAEPQSVFYAGLVKNTQEHIQDLTANLVTEKKLREKEIIELHLTGKLASHGTLPLDILGKLSTTFADALIHASKQVHSGNRKGAGILREVKRTLDLRFECTAPGSTRIFITGQTSPDLFGRSLIEESLENTFGLLGAGSGDKLLDYAAKCGMQSLRHFKNFFSAIQGNDLEVDIVWDSPLEKEHKWEGSVARISGLSGSLSHIVSEAPEEHEIEAVLIASSLKRVFEIRDKNKRTYKGSYPTSLFNKVKDIRIGEDCYCLLEETRTVNKTTGQQRSSFLLKDIEPLE